MGAATRRLRRVHIVVTQPPGARTCGVEAERPAVGEPAFSSVPPPQGIRTVQLTPRFGLRVEGLTRGPVPPGSALARWLVASLHQHGVLVLGGQRHLAEHPADFRDLARLFGEPYIWKPDGGHLLPSLPEVITVANIGTEGVLSWDAERERVAVDFSRNDPGDYFNQNAMFHTDHAFMEVPCAATMLLPALLPAEAQLDGQETSVINLRAAYEELPAELRAAIAGKTGRHCWGPGALDHWMAEHNGDGWIYEKPTQTVGQVPRTVTSSAASLALAANPVHFAHRLDRAHPVLGTPTVYAPFGTLATVDGMPPEETLALLQGLAAHSMSERYRFTHVPSYGDLLIYDNDQTAHRSSPQQRPATGMEDVRLLYRISTKGLPPSCNLHQQLQ
jgi:alpha-ketoglutarate-dependent taurine dioxygenase